MPNPSQLKPPKILMYSQTSSSSPSFSSYPPEIFSFPIPCEKEDLPRQRISYEVEVFWHYGESVLNHFGVHPEYQFAQIFIVQPRNFPKPLLWFFWCLCHEHHILIEFQCLFFTQNLLPNLVTLLQWFKPLLYWITLFAENPRYLIFHLHRPIHMYNQELQALPWFTVYRHLSHTILDQEHEYSKAQRYIFQENKVISQEIWLRPQGLWNYISSHPHWEAVRKAKADCSETVLDSQMQDS